MSRVVNISLAKRLGCDYLEGIPLDVLAVNIPQPIKDAIKQSANLNVFNVTGNEIYPRNILKCDEIIFSAGSILTLNEMRPGVDFVAIVAKTIKFVAPEMRTLIQRNVNSSALPAVHGAKGANGYNGGEDSGGGTGDPGMPGQQGQAAATLKLPTLYLIGGKIANQEGNPINWMNVTILITGIAGGSGGNGGEGGRGGEGGNGHNAFDGIGGCAKSGGNGGNGGTGGPGGPAGHGGGGGDGANLVFGGDENFVDKVTFSNVNNTPGLGGAAGRPGRGGIGGGGGPGGGGSTFCSGGHGGSRGANGPDGPVGENGRGGSKGMTDISILDVNIFY